MKNFKYFYSFLLLATFVLSSCNKNNDDISSDSSYEEETFTVIWKNYDNSILEVDENVTKGTVPTYDGNTPTRENDDLYTYTFNGWNPEVGPIYKNTSFVATFTQNEINIDEETFTITWINYDDTVLEVDENVKKGTIPTYDGDTPVKASEGSTSFEFNGWTPNIYEVSKNQTYKATFKAVDNSINLDGNPSINSDNNIEYGYYPFNHVSDASLIDSIKNSGTLLGSGYHSYNNKLYSSVIASTYPGGGYDFSSGVTITDGEEYWFEVQKIEWIILKNIDNNTYYLTSKYLLDVSPFYSSYENRVIEEETIYPNNYLYSDLKTNLNNHFYDTFFYYCNDYIVANDEQEKISALSYQELFDSSLGFETVEGESSNTRTAKVSDYALALGAWASHGKDQTAIKNNPYEYNGMYWTKTSSLKFTYSSYVCNSSGFLSEYVVDRNSVSIRPVIILNYSF